MTRSPPLRSHDDIAYKHIEHNKIERKSPETPYSCELCQDYNLKAMRSTDCWKGNMNMSLSDIT